MRFGQAYLAITQNHVECLFFNFELHSKSGSKICMYCLVEEALIIPRLAEAQGGGVRKSSSTPMQEMGLSAYQDQQQTR